MIVSLFVLVPVLVFLLLFAVGDGPLLDWEDEVGFRLGHPE